MLVQSKRLWRFAAAHEWIRHSGLATDGRGFLLVNTRMQSVRHAEVFGIDRITDREQ